MSDIACLFNMDLLDEGEMLREDILQGKALEVLICIYEGNNTIADISKKLDLAVYSVKLYINRLIKAGVITEICRLKGEHIEREYALSVNDMKLINVIKDNTDDTDKAAKHFSKLVMNAVSQAEIEPEKPNKVKAYFIKANSQRIKEFTKDVDRLFEKFKEYEDLEEEDTYQLLNVFAPYK